MGFLSPSSPHWGHSSGEDSQGGGQDTHFITRPSTYTQPWAGTQTLTCGGWQAGGHSGAEAPQG